MQYRLSIIDNYFNFFENTKNNLHLFSIIENRGFYIDCKKYNINDVFDFDSYNIFIENLVFFCLSNENKFQKY